MTIKEAKQYLDVVWALKHLWESSISTQDKKKAMTIVYNILVSFFDEAYKDKSNWDYGKPNYYLDSLKRTLKEYREKIKGLK